MESEQIEFPHKYSYKQTISKSTLSLPGKQMTESKRNSSMISKFRCDQWMKTINVTYLTTCDPGLRI